MLSLLLSLLEITDRESLRFVYSEEQGYDSSCGLSTLVCLMATYWDVPASESALARDFLKEKLKAGDYTTNFADMKRILEAKGFKVAAYKMNLSQLSKAAEKYAPLLVHYAEPEGHFVLVLSVQEESVVVADPAQGLEMLALRDFEARWSGHVLLAAIPNQKPNGVALDGARAEALGRDRLLEHASLIQAGAARW